MQEQFKWVFVLDKKGGGRQGDVCNAVTGRWADSSQMHLQHTSCGRGLLATSKYHSGVALITGRVNEEVVLKVDLQEKSRESKKNETTVFESRENELIGICKKLCGHKNTFLAKIDGANKVVLHADELGEIPVAYLNDADYLVLVPAVADFAPLRNKFFDLTIDKFAFSDFILNGSFGCDVSMFNEIKKLFPGSIVEINGAVIKFIAPERLIYCKNDEAQSSNAAEYGQLTSILSSVITDKTGNNGRAAVLLSSGVDSACVAAIAARTVPDLTAISVGSIYSQTQEVEYARKIAQKLGIRFVKVEIDHLELDRIQDIYSGAQEPYGYHSLIPTYFGVDAAGQITGNVLTGDGGDGYFGAGDALVMREKYDSWFAARKKFPALHELSPEIRVALSKFFAVAAKVLRSSKKSDLDNLFDFLNMSCFEDWTYFYQKINPDGSIRFPGRHKMPKIDQLRRVYEQFALDPSLLSDNASSRLYWYFFSAVLPKVQTNMATFGVAGIYPLLNRRVADFSNKLPPDEKIDKKYLRNYAKSIFNDSEVDRIFDMPKRGFGFPIRRLVRDFYYGEIFDVIKSSRLAKCLGYTHEDFNLSFKETLLLGRYDKRAWHFFCAAVWYEKFCSESW